MPCGAVLNVKPPVRFLFITKVWVLRRYSGFFSQSLDFIVNKVGVPFKGQGASQVVNLLYELIIEFLKFFVDFLGLHKQCGSLATSPALNKSHSLWT